MVAFVFDPTEFASLLVSIIGMSYLLYAYFYKKKKYEEESNFSLGIFLCVVAFVFLNRIFTNVEAIAYKELFNLLEHLAMLLSGLFAIALAWGGMRHGIR